MKRQKKILRTIKNPVNLSLKEGEGEGIRTGEGVHKSESLREGEGIRRGEDEDEDEKKISFFLLPSSFFLLPSSFFLLDLILFQPAKHSA